MTFSIKGSIFGKIKFYEKTYILFDYNTDMFS